MSIVKSLMFAACAMMVACAAGGAEIRNVTAKHRYPWGKVDITYEVVGDVSEGISDWFCPVLVVTATNRIAGACYIAAADFLSGDVGTEEGLHHVVWDLKAQGFHFKSDDVLFRVAYCEKIKPSYQYCVIDLAYNLISCCEKSEFLGTYA